MPNNFNFVNNWIGQFKTSPSKLDINKFEDLSHSWAINHKKYTPIFPNWYKKKLSKLEKIFSVVNEKNHKVIRFCGVKVKFKRAKSK